MSPAAISLAALVFALALSCVSTINVGFVAIVLAWIVGTTVAGLRVEQVVGAFPATLFVTLAGITLLFAQAQNNGTLDRIAHKAVHYAKGTPGLIPILFFLMTAAIASMGPGNIASVALMAPLGMAAAGRYKISPFLMAIMIANGGAGGSLSPLTPTGVIVNGLAAKMGLEGVQWAIYLNNLVVHAGVAMSGYLLLGGWKLLGRREVVDAAPVATDRPMTPFGWRQWVTTAVIAALVASVIAFNINVGVAAFAGAVLLTLVRAADEQAAVRAMPWGVIMMVCGVTVLVSLLERTGGIALFAQFLARVSTPDSATAVAGFFTGLISVYSSTTGVVLPALLPTIPDLIKNMGGGDAMAIMSSMNVSGHLVDVSPLSTLGALCLAAAPPGTDTRALFNKLLAWGLSMTVVGATVSWVAFR
jgi:di/tricarboxylate transporter